MKYYNIRYEETFYYSNIATERARVLNISYFNGNKKVKLDPQNRMDSVFKLERYAIFFEITTLEDLLISYEIIPPARNFPCEPNYWEPDIRFLAQKDKNITIINTSDIYKDYLFYRGYPINKFSKVDFLKYFLTDLELIAWLSENN